MQRKPAAEDLQIERSQSLTRRSAPRLFSSWGRPWGWLVVILLVVVAPAVAQSDLGLLGKAAGKIRGLSYRPISSQVVTQKEASEYVLRLLDAELEPRRTRTREEFLRATGLMPRDETLRSILGPLYASQVRGLYDPLKKRYIVVKGSPEGSDVDAAAAALGLNTTDIFAIHELGHAIQDQHFDLRQLEKQVINDFDKAIAAQSLIEGDATVLMTDYLMDQMGLDPSMLDFSGGLDGGLGLDMDSLMTYDPNLGEAPPFFRDYLTLPYSQGMAFVSAVKRQGGWKAVNKAYRSLPASSEQVLHPEKYLKQSDPPKPVKLQSLPQKFGDYKAFGEDTAGEFTVRAWEKQFVPSNNHRGSEGWGGDRYRVYASGKQAFVIWTTVWDSPQDAGEFEALSRAVLKRIKSPRPEKNGATLRFTDSAKRVTLLSREGTRVTLALDIPTKLVDEVAKKLL